MTWRESVVGKSRGGRGHGEKEREPTTGDLFREKGREKVEYVEKKDADEGKNEDGNVEGKGRRRGRGKRH